MKADINNNLKAFLDMLAWCEGTSISKYTKNNGYDVIVNGVDSPKIFSDYTSHPNILVTVNSKGLKSTAAGRYQLLSRYYKHYKDLLNLPDFSPDSQDAIAIQQIKERRALNDIVNGDIKQAIEKVNNIWASLPDSKYNQPTRTMDACLAKYKEMRNQYQ